MGSSNRGQQIGDRHRAGENRPNDYRQDWLLPQGKQVHDKANHAEQTEECKQKKRQPTQRYRLPVDERPPAICGAKQRIEIVVRATISISLAPA